MEGSYQSTDNQHSSFLVDVFTTGDNVPFLTITAVTSSHLNRRKICSEVPGQLID